MAPLLLLFILLLPHSTTSDSIGQYCDKDFQSPQIQTSITTVLFDLQTKAPISGFATSSAGQDQNIVYGLAQCRGDVSSADCTSCIDEATQKVKTICPKKADVRIWYDYCFMRFNTNNFIGKADTGYAVIYINVENATDPERFDVEVGSLMSKVREKAVVAGNGGLGRGKSEFTPYVTIYGLAQCTRDLEPLPCAQCLSSAVEKFPEYCRYRKGCQVLYSSCIVRYEVYPFFYPLDDNTSYFGNSNITSDHVGQYLVVTVVT
ncbi:cysteine-rich repeat secretory protein 55-like [Dioscorea cayenensis subsp. rotundata]|uniref:Cysteine-rich repeat secretory protein 55-like n=1 Tax=Dioscorea cayennensis subsp. rotundata TaxID=55577 RepID=A0AB40CA77_DIOCR|nr:cysteine-rich repeat secretory protein 55-like [Dioscorea cayenensis subsp. rotundata]